MIPLASNTGKAKQGAGNKLLLFAWDSEALFNLQHAAFFFLFPAISSHNNGAFSTLLLWINVIWIQQMSARTLPLWWVKHFWRVGLRSLKLLPFSFMHLFPPGTSLFDFPLVPLLSEALLSIWFCRFSSLFFPRQLATRGRDVDPEEWKHAVFWLAGCLQRWAGLPDSKDVAKTCFLFFWPVGAVGNGCKKTKNDLLSVGKKIAWVPPTNG